MCNLNKDDASNFNNGDGWVCVKWSLIKVIARLDVAEFRVLLSFGIASLNHFRQIPNDSLHHRTLYHISQQRHIVSDSCLPAFAVTISYAVIRLWIVVCTQINMIDAENKVIPMSHGSDSLYTIEMKCFDN